ncbi:hypothetical protein RR46_13179 [Papilio xuthus]|uniref:Uncharacterized protein n=1 Tax=Papilio xuthus TaxID=66420 RepID=A0A194PMQ4_PAPXU|nr:hypothetical protein RR46_13179 [Papilio xuthus]
MSGRYTGTSSFSTGSGALACRTRAAARAVCGALSGATLNRAVVALQNNHVDTPKESNETQFPVVQTKSKFIRNYLRTRYSDNELLSSKQSFSQRDLALVSRRLQPPPPWPIGVRQRSDSRPANGLQEKSPDKRTFGANLQKRNGFVEGNREGRDARGDGVRLPVQKPTVELHHTETQHEENIIERLVFFI